MSLRGIEALANDPAVRAALAKIPRVVEPKTNPAVVGARSKTAQRGHSMRRVINVCVAIIGQRAARGQATEAAFDELGKAVAHWEALRKK